MLTKTCTKCKVVKSLNEFAPRKQRKNNPFASCCRKCEALQKRKYRSENKEHCKTLWKNWRDKNKDKVKVQNRKQYIKNRRNRILLAKEYATKNKDKVRIYNNTYQRERKKYDMWFKLKKILGRRMHHVLVDSHRKSITDKYIGCTGEQFRKHIESLFTSGMSWENYGSEWVVDHRIPLCSINPENTEQLEKVCHFSNLQPMWYGPNSEKAAQDKLWKKKIKNY